MWFYMIKKLNPPKYNTPPGGPFRATKYDPPYNSRGGVLYLGGFYFAYPSGGLTFR